MSDPSVIDHSLDGESRITAIVAILAAGGAITTSVVGLRIYTRAFLLRTFGFEDGFMIAAQTLAIAAAVAIGLGMSNIACTLTYRTSAHTFALCRSKIWTGPAHLASTRGVLYSIHEGTASPRLPKVVPLLTWPPASSHSTAPSSCTMSPCASSKSRSYYNTDASSPALSCGR